MTHRNDCKKLVLETALSTTGHINDLELAYWQSLGSTANNLNDARLEYYLANGATSSNINDAENEYYIALGATSSNRADNANWFWCVNGGAVSDPNADLEWSAGLSEYQRSGANASDDDFELHAQIDGVGSPTFTTPAGLQLPDHASVATTISTNTAPWYGVRWSGGKAYHNTAPGSTTPLSNNWGLYAAPAGTWDGIVVASAITIAYDIGNHADDQGAYYCEYTRLSDGGTNRDGLISFNTSFSLRQQSTVSFRSQDGTNVLDSASALIAIGSAVKVGHYYDAIEALMGINYEGATTEGAYDGVFEVLSSIRILAGEWTNNKTGFPALIRNIRRYNLDYASSKAKLAELML